MGLVSAVREYMAERSSERAILRRLREVESRFKGRSIVESVSDVFDSVVDQEDEFEGWLRLNDERYFDAATNAPNLASMRRVVRRVVWQSGIAQGGLQAVADYVVGTGLTYKFAPPRGTPPEEAENWKEVIAAANAEWESFAEDQAWPITENDLVRIMHRDGDAFVQLFDTKNGIEVRYVDADDVRDPGTGVNAPWGIEVDPIDEQTAVNYFVDGAEIPADEMIHLRVNSDPSVPRGTPTLWSVRNNVIRAERLVRNMARLGEVQAAIAIVREHTYPISSEKIKNVLDAAADKTPTDPYTGKTKRQQKLNEGSIVDVSGGTKLTFPTVGTSLTNYPPAIQAALRPVAARLGITEFMLTADASNSNYASTFVALAPVVKSLQTQQARVIAVLRPVPYKVIASAVRRGLLDRKALQLVCNINGPEVSNRDELQQANIREIEKRNGVLSTQTWTAESGRDYDEEQRQIAEHSLATGGVAENPLTAEDPAATPTSTTPQSGSPAAPGVPAPAAGGPTSSATATATTTPASATAGPKQEIQVQTDLVLNGAQISAAKDIVLAVAAGELPRDSGLGMLQTFFNLTPEKAASIMGSAGTSTPTTPNPNPAATPEPAPPAPSGAPVPPKPDASQPPAA